MDSKDFLSSGSGDEKSTNNLYASHPQDNNKKKLNIRVLTARLAWFLSAAYFISILVYAASPTAIKPAIIVIKVFIFIIVILNFIVFLRANKLYHKKEGHEG